MLLLIDNTQNSICARNGGDKHWFWYQSKARMRPASEYHHHHHHRQRISSRRKSYLQATNTNLGLHRMSHCLHVIAQYWSSEAATGMYCRQRWIVWVMGETVSVVLVWPTVSEIPRCRTAETLLHQVYARTHMSAKLYPLRRPATTDERGKWCDVLISFCVSLILFLFCLFLVNSRSRSLCHLPSVC